jgi:hypothetical protein
VELREMMCEGRLEVKQGLPPNTDNAGERESRAPAAFWSHNPIGDL